MQWFHLEFLKANGSPPTFGAVRHTYGETIPGADLPSRGRLAELEELSRQLGVRLTRFNGERVFLDELPADYLPAEELENISCGPDCQLSLAI